VSESKIIQELAAKESCIIVGRCADFVLKDYPKVLKLFCYSDLSHSVTRCVSEYGIAKESAETEIKRVNRNRIHHYEYYTGEKWGEPHRYDLMLNTGALDLKTACQLVRGVYQGLEKA
jgi:cytidylate kinase